MKTAYLNNKFIPLDKASISILDRGLLYGDGLFETMRSYKGVVFLLEKHLRRLKNSLGNLDIGLRAGPQEIKKIIYSLLDKNKLKDAYLKIIVTRGKANGLPFESRREKPTFIVYALPYDTRPERVYRKGIKACISKNALNEKSKITGDKTLCYLSNVLGRKEAEKQGFDDIIFTNSEGFVSEASSSNIFWFRKNTLFTPPLRSGCLGGIIRSEVMRLAKKTVNLNEKLAGKEALFGAEEIFLTNSLTGIIPVVKVESLRIGGGRQGPATKQMTDLLKNRIADYCNAKKR